MLGDHRDPQDFSTGWAKETRWTVGADSYSQEILAEGRELGQKHTLLIASSSLLLGLLLAKPDRKPEGDPEGLALRCTGSVEKGRESALSQAMLSTGGVV